MTIKELIDALNRLVAEDEFRSDMQVMWEGETPVAGGIVGKDGATGLATLLLTATKLDQVGGF